MCDVLGNVCLLSHGPRKRYQGNHFVMWSKSQGMISEIILSKTLYSLQYATAKPNPCYTGSVIYILVINNENCNILYSLHHCPINKPSLYLQVLTSNQSHSWLLFILCCLPGYKTLLTPPTAVCRHCNHSVGCTGPHTQPHWTPAAWLRHQTCLVPL